jgi:D-galactarolactone isomerase
MRDPLADFAMPDGACDCHMHIYGGPGPVPSPFPIPVANVDGYRAVMRRLGLSRVVVVQSMLYANDNTIMLDTIRELGPCARGVAVVDREATPADLAALDAVGVRGVRAYMLGGGPYGWDDLPALAERIVPFGWHLQIQMDGRNLTQVAPLLRGLATPIVLDQVGKFLEPVAADHPSFAALRRLVAEGRCWVKLSGVYETSRTGPPEYADVSALASILAADAPERMVWGTNWPHPNLHPPPDDLALLRHFATIAPETKLRNRILADNPAELCRFAATDGGSDEFQ